MKNIQIISPGYKSSPLGPIPCEWEVKKLEEVIESLTNGLTYDPGGTSGYPITRIETIADGTINSSKVGFTPYFDSFEKFKLKKGDILYSHINSVAQIGKTAFCADDYEILHGMNLLRLRTKSTINSKFIFYLLNSKYGRKSAFSGAKRAVNQASLSTAEIKLFQFSFPSLLEQNKITNCLSTWDEAITKTQAVIAQKELAKKWLMQQLLTGKKRLPGFGGEWKKYQYETLLKVIKRTTKWDNQELHNLISVRRRSGGIFARESLYGHQILVKDLRTVKAGDFLFSKMQIVHGASAVVTEEFENSKISGSYISVVAKDPTILSMEYFNLNSQRPYFYHQTYISSYGVHIEKMTFDFEGFLTLEMNLPPMEEQVAIINCIKVSDNEITLLKTKLEKLKEQKKGLMQMLLTGKKRLGYR